ncbi:MAG TPA: PQQ-binding-like beta-propeller repeat protein, partial [Luteolibacter sp.]|nr:PQQ-binding-like beta-propeller repeat protein [Luteolibacter sp.]
PRLLDDEGYPGTKGPWGTLNCIDLATGKIAWRVPLGRHPELEAKGYMGTGTENFGGAIATAGGLVFCGGTKDEMIRAFDAKDGKELWSAKLPWGGYAPPATYEIDGKQYVIISATGGGKLGGVTGDAYVAFALE